MKNIFLLSIIFVLSVWKAESQSFSLVPFSTGILKPTDIKNAGDDRLFALDQTGKIRIIDTNGVMLPTPFLNIQSRVLSTGNEQGLLGLAFDPNYSTNGYFYVDYSGLSGGRTTISRFSVSTTNPDSADANSEQILLTIYQPYTNHNGGDLNFGPDGYLYIGMGDGGSAGDPGNRAQNKDSLLGKMLRIDVSGGGPTYAIPPTNPFVGTTGRDEIWTTGMRNPWRWCFDSWTGDLWIADVGQNIYEEVDFQPASSHGGENYGWRCYEGNNTYNTTGCLAASNYKFPIYTYSHTGGLCSITGGYIYRGAEYANMFGKYFLIDYCVPSLRYIVRDTAGAFHGTTFGNVRGATFTTFGLDKWGEIYMASQNDTIYKLIGTSCNPTAFLSDKDTIHICGGSSYLLHTPKGKGFNYSWNFNGGPITGADSSSFLATQSGSYSVTVSNRSSCSNADTIYISFDSIPVLDLSGIDTVYCAGGSQVTLSGIPAGGIFSGDGVTGNSFSPSVAGYGLHNITYSYTSPAGCSNSDSITVRVDSCLGIYEYSSITDLSIYPNPGTGEFAFAFYFASSQMMQLEITDILGRKIYSEELMLAQGSYHLPLHLNFESGVYYLKAATEKGSRTLRFLINDK